MKKITHFLLLFLFIAQVIYLNAQSLTTPAGGGNKKAAVTEWIGLTCVTLHYDRPGVKGREGKIWGQLVPYGFQDLGFGTSKAAPWRAGANENTTIEFSTDVKVEGKDLAAGKYGLFIALSEGEAIVIFSKNNSSWGSFFYKPDEDALRVTVKTVPLTESVERLKFEFLDQTDNAATIALMWEKLKIPFKVETDLIKTQLTSFRNELRSDKGFQSQAWVQAANFCVENNVNLPEALEWADYGISGVFIGQKNFQTLSAKANVLRKMGKTTEAEEIMKQALPLAPMNDLHQYARGLLRQKRYKDAYELFKMNYDKNPNEFTTLVGMARGYSAMGDYKTALEFAEKALVKAPDAGNKASLSDMISKLKEGKDVN